MVLRINLQSGSSIRSEQEKYNCYSAQFEVAVLRSYEDLKVLYYSLQNLLDHSTTLSSTNAWHCKQYIT